MLEDIFNQYREINLKIIELVKEDKSAITLFEKREEIIKNIFSLNLEKSEINKIYIEKGLKILDKELENILIEKMLLVKDEIKKITIQKQANLRYVNANRTNNFFSKIV